MFEDALWRGEGGAIILQYMKACFSLRFHTAGILFPHFAHHINLRLAASAHILTSMSSFQWRKGQYFKGSVYCLFSCVSGRKSGCVTILSAAVSCRAQRIVPLLTSSGEPNICFQSHLLCKSMSVLSYYVLTAYLHKLSILS